MPNKFLNKAEAVTALGGTVALGLLVSWPVGIVAGGAWGVWRLKRYINQLRDESARKRGYRDYEDFLRKQ